MRLTTATSLVTPTAAGTTLLFNSYTAFLGSPLDTTDVVRYIFTVDNTQAGTIRGSRSDDGTTWYVFVSQAVPIPAGVTDSGPIDFPIDGLKYVKFEWINGGVDQTTWHPQQEIVERQRAAQT